MRETLLLSFAFGLFANSTALVKPYTNWRELSVAWRVAAFPTLLYCS